MQPKGQMEKRTSLCLLRCVYLNLILLLYSCQLLRYCHAVGYSYARFTGPVSGPEHKILVKDAFSDVTRVDYVARPDYEFAYGVEDGKTRVLQNRKESRDGDAVKGVYSVVDPDGTLRVVKYTADNVNGFQAEVIANGVTTIHGHGDGPTAAVEDGQDDDDDDHDAYDGHGDGGGADGDIDTKTLAHWHVETGSAQSTEDDGEDEANDLKHNDGEYEVYEDYKENDDGEETDAGNPEDEEEEAGEDDEHAEGEESEEFE